MALLGGEPRPTPSPDPVLQEGVPVSPPQLPFGV